MNYYDNLMKCADRYYQMLVVAMCPAEEDLLKFLFEFAYAIRDKAPLPKLNRWLGYIQGCMIERGYTTVDAERDFTRPLFRPIDFDNDERFEKAWNLVLEAGQFYAMTENEAALRKAKNEFKEMFYGLR